MAHGPESWHPNPGIFYLEGAGPLFDMGPYYLTALVNLMGPVARVAGSARMTFPERIATSEALMGQRLPVEVNTHIAGTLEFASGAIASLITSFDVWGHRLPPIEVHGADGSLSVPDPNNFDGVVRAFAGGSSGWADVAQAHSGSIGRGAGVADMAYAIQSGRPHRASGDLAFHVLDIMLSLEESAALGRHVDIRSGVAQPAALPAGLGGWRAGLVERIPHRSQPAKKVMRMVAVSTQATKSSYGCRGEPVARPILDKEPSSHFARPANLDLRETQKAPRCQGVWRARPVAQSDEHSSTSLTVSDPGLPRRIENLGNGRQ